MCTVCMMTQVFDPLRHGPDQPIFADINEVADAAEDISTTYTMAVGDSFLGNIQSSSDEDWIRVELTAGTEYEIAHNGISLSDPLVRLYDAAGNQIDSNDDGGSGLNSLLTYTATTTGTYYISADAFSSNTGTYALSLSENIPTPPPGTVGSLEELGTFLLEGTQGFSRSYNTSQSNVITVNITGLTADGQQLARWAMEAWEMVADLDFVEVTSGEMITLDDEDSGAFAYYPNAGSTSTARGDNTDGVELNVSRAWLTNSGTTLDSYSFQTYVHEFGHALGLRHQGIYDASQGPVTYQDHAYFTNDSWQMSVMSYFSQTENTSTNAAYAYTSGAMMADIWAIQELYGAPDENSATAGDTTYGAGSTLGNYLDDIFAWMSTGNTTADVTGNLMAYTIYDRDGIDTFDFSFTTNDARLDMRDGQFSDFGTLTGILGIAQGTVIENAVLGAGNDTVTGNTAANNITTGDGDDSVTGDLGADTLTGQNGNDTLAGGDDNDSIVGGNGNDSILGGQGYDTLRGGDGNDTINGGDGADSVFMGGGNDLFVDNSQDGVHGQDTVFANGGNDTIGGGAGDDEFHGQGGSDRILGRLGDDEIFGGDQNDTLNGGDGNDTLTGGNGRDRAFLGNGNDRWIDNDQVQFGDASVGGGAGNDWIQAGGGNDTLAGGGGADTFVLVAAINDDIITDYQVGMDALEITTSLWNGALSQARLDALTGVANGNLVFSFDNGDSLTLEGVTSTTGLLGDIDLI